MKLISLTLALVAVGKVAAYSSDLEAFYGLVCDDHTQTEDLSGTTSQSYLPYTDNSFFQFTTGYFLGAQSDMNITDSSCFVQAYQTKQILDTMADYVYSLVTDVASFSFSSAAGDLTNLAIQLNSFNIQMSDQNTACVNSLFIKQFATRTQTIPGLFNAIFSLGYGIGYNILTDYVSFLPAASQQNMNIAALNIYNQVVDYFSAGTLMDCQELGLNFGLLVSEFLEAKIPTSVDYTEVAAWDASTNTFSTTTA